MSRIFPACLWMLCFLSITGIIFYHPGYFSRGRAFAFNEIDFPEERDAVPAASDTAVWESRDFFQLPSGPAEEEAQQPPPQVSRLRQDYRLAAVMMDHDPVIMMEQKNRGETLFLRAGEEIGGIRLERIEKGKAVFNDRGQAVELWIKE